MSSPTFLLVALLPGLAGLARVVFLLGWRLPVRARLVGTMLGPGELAHERRTPWADREDRGLVCKVAYEVAGREYRADVWLISARGDLPPANPTVWFDPADPARASGLGLGSALAVMAASAGLALTFLYS